MPLPDPWTDDEVFKLRQGSREPGTFRVGKGGGAAVLSMKVRYDKLVDLLKSGVESARPTSIGKINRTLPVAHPFLPWMFLRDIDNAQGLSFVEKVEADPQGQLEAPSLEYVSQYQWYELQGRFEPRPYAVVPDSSINSYTITYYDEAGDQQTKTAYTEDYRYVEWMQKPAAEYLTADKGQFVFAALNAPTGGPNDNASAGVGQIRKLIPAAVWILKWHMVPYNYVLSEDTYFSRYVGHVNQQAIWGFGAGEALLQAVNVSEVYSPTFPEFDSYSGYDVVSQNKLCDIEFVFLEANRTPTVAVTPTNLSHIAGGHNCVVYAADSRYYYVENFRGNGAMGTGKPIYPSVPFDLLFQNPDGNA